MEGVRSGAGAGMSLGAEWEHEAHLVERTLWLEYSTGL